MKIVQTHAQSMRSFFKTLAFCARARYNSNMKLQKIGTEGFIPPACVFGAPRHVQGAEVQTAENAVRIVSGGKFKRFPAGDELLHIVRGTGFIKWARGETAFAAQETFRAEGLEEYELNGEGEFLVVRV